MENYRLVLPEDLNQFGHLFGGRLLAWVDEASWIAASLDYPLCRFVTVAMDEAIFRHSVKEGSILTIKSEKAREGTTSVTYKILVFRGRSEYTEPIFSTQVSFVNLTEEGEKTPIIK